MTTARWVRFGGAAFTGLAVGGATHIWPGTEHLWLWLVISFTGYFTARWLAARLEDE